MTNCLVQAEWLNISRKLGIFSRNDICLSRQMTDKGSGKEQEVHPSIRQPHQNLSADYVCSPWFAPFGVERKLGTVLQKQLSFIKSSSALLDGLQSSQLSLALKKSAAHSHVFGIQLALVKF
mmetsp:Transcript_2996/g.4284  ORF Transcript_2996/g.4284 Transcript_2996/m.4284 type:complete len:122 (+) Transcript_2996:108-473(+)